MRVASYREPFGLDRERGNILHSVKPGSGRRADCREGQCINPRGGLWMLEVPEGGSRPHVGNQVPGTVPEKPGISDGHGTEQTR